MGYARSTTTITKRESLLAPLLQFQSFTWTNVAKPEELAYKIRECFAIAKRNPEQFPALVRASKCYRIETMNGSVNARYIPEMDPALIEQQKPTPFNPVVMQEEGPIVLTSPNTVPGVVQLWLNHYPNPRPLLLTEVNLTNKELADLEAWGMETKQQVVLDAENRTLVIKPNAEG